MCVWVCVCVCVSVCVWHGSTRMQARYPIDLSFLSLTGKHDSVIGSVTTDVCVSECVGKLLTKISHVHTIRHSLSVKGHHHGILPQK